MDDKVPFWRPPPQGAVRRMQDEHDGEEAVTSLGLYCQSCFALSRDLNGLFSSGKLVTEDGELVMVAWDVHLKKLADAAESGCQFCGFMASRFFNDRAYSFFYGGASSSTLKCCAQVPRTDVKDTVHAAVATVRKFLEDYPEARFSLVVEPMDRSEVRRTITRIQFRAWKTSVDQKGVNQILSYRDRIVLEMYAQKDDPAGQDILCRPVHIYPQSDESMEQAKTWIADCLENHEHCPGPKDSKLPTRVLQIRDDETIQLCTDEFGHYSILSYCWGGTQPFATTIATLDNNLKGFSISNLPQALQDAARVTRKLGLKYLWVDSLCIIQDSITDKDNEIPKMADYYKNAYVTICSGGKSCNDGFLETCDECKAHPGLGIPDNLLKLPYLCRNEDVGTVYFREESPYFLTWEPVYKRAWTLQEQTLSPRILTYGSRLLWQCHSSQHSHGGVEDWSMDMRRADCRSLHVAFTGKDMGSEDDDASEEVSSKRHNKSSALYGNWYTAVQEYSSRKMTLSEDKLSGIAGLAIEFSTRTKDDYLAGLWRRDLLQGLMWSTYPNLALIRPSAWRAPSWSWASIDNHVTFDRLPPREAEPLSHVVKCEVSARSSASPFAHVSSAVLEIEGPLLANIGGEAAKKMLREEYIMPGPTGKGEDWRRFFINFTAHGSPGVSNEEWEPPEEVACLLLFATPIPKEQDESKGKRESKSEDKSKGGEESKREEEEPGHIVCGLVLEDKGEGTYERVTCFTNVRFKGLENLGERRQVVRIV